jgi:hypothetical protein
MTNSLNILLMVLAVNGLVLGLGVIALYGLNRAVDKFDH